jgi:hypothetical protein
MYSYETVLSWSLASLRAEQLGDIDQVYRAIDGSRICNAHSA